MVTYTIGFSNDATTWPGASNIFAPAASDRLPFKFTGSFQDLVTGTKTWPQWMPKQALAGFVARRDQQQQAASTR